MQSPIKKRAVLYCRVSTKEQVEEGNSLASQEKNCREYAIKNGFEVIATFIEQGESAKTANRTELQKLLTFCAVRKNNIHAVIAYKIDRISRNTDDYSQIRILLKRYGVEIKSTSEFFENTPAGRFMENIIANVAQFDNDVRTERSVGGMKDAMREGRYVWQAPIGYSNVRIHGKATITQNTLAPVIRQCFEEIAKNTNTAEDVRAMMIKKGLIQANGKPLTKSPFYRMLKNVVYKGVIQKFGEQHKGLFEPIVSEELFEQVQRVLRYGKRRNLHYLSENPDFPLRRFIQHPDGIKLTGGWAQGKTKKYPYYLFHKKPKVFKKSYLENWFMELLDQLKFNDDHFIKLKKYVHEHLELKNMDNKLQAEKLRKHITGLKEKQNMLIQKNLSGIISDAVLSQQLDDTERHLMQTTADLAQITHLPVNFDQIFLESKDVLQSPAKLWEMAPFQLKLKLQWFYFPKGIIFDGVESKTPEISFIFKAKKAILDNFSSEVTLRLSTLNSVRTPNNQNTFLEQCFSEHLALEFLQIVALKRSNTDTSLEIFKDDGG
ncbi:recombinase family protein [Limnovirga soli]|uniref:Recombinase family protein n=1 Tax=Limnovirga soli TaxID=2656915 RepID=A0A8J8F9Z1_9BACT|nr:recombinase family protein [Limnovirga soli]NNV53875.1 hypothetical protein [Limnovirga soli]